jgi:hypothetical protein
MHTTMPETVAGAQQNRVDTDITALTEVMRR